MKRSDAVSIDVCDHQFLIIVFLILLERETYPAYTAPSLFGCVQTKRYIGVHRGILYNL